VRDLQIHWHDDMVVRKLATLGGCVYSWAMAEVVVQYNDEDCKAREVSTLSKVKTQTLQRIYAAQELSPLCVVEVKILPLVRECAKS
jgi:hypothetical protein